jgi:hypothetical protein
VLLLKILKNSSDTTDLMIKGKDLVIVESLLAIKSKQLPKRVVPLLRCAEAVEAELLARHEGPELALAHNRLPIITESECSRVILAA